MCKTRTGTGTGTGTGTDTDTQTAYLHKTFKTGGLPCPNNNKTDGRNDDKYDKKEGDEW